MSTNADTQYYVLRRTDGYLKTGNGHCTPKLYFKGNAESVAKNALNKYNRRYDVIPVRLIIGAINES